MRAAKKPKDAPHRERRLLVVPGLLALVLAAYHNCFDAGFTLDSRRLILQDPRLRAVTRENLDLVLGHTYWWPYSETGLYRPFTTLSYLFNYAVLGNGTDPAGYHWINLALHALNVLLAYFLARRFVNGRWAPAALAGLWAVHPVLTESVTNIVGRSDLLAGTAVLGGLWCYLKAAESTGFRRAVWLAGLAAVTATGVFSKESAVAILGVLALYAAGWQKPRQRIGSLLPAYAAVLLPVLAMWWVRSRVLATAPHAVFPFSDNPLVGAGFWQAKLTALAVLGRYVWLILWPVRLSSDYSYAQIPLARGSLADWAAWLTVVLVLAATAFLFTRKESTPRTAAFFLVFAFLNVAPVANLLFPIGTIMAERFLYLPALGLCACAVLAVSSGVRQPAAAAALLAVALAASGARTYARNADWRDDLTLASADVQSSPDSYKTHLRLADSLYEFDLGHTNIEAAIGEMENSLAIIADLPDPLSTPTAYLSGGGYYLVKGARLLRKSPDGEAVLTPESRKAYQRSVQILKRGLSIIAALRAAGLNAAFSEEAEGRRMLSADYLRLSEMPEALDSALEARRADPLDPQMYWQLFNVLISQERTFEAATVLVQGGVITGDPSMRAELIRLYRMGLDPKDCALLPGSGALNPDCETVHQQICAAAVGLEQLSRETPRTDTVGQLRKIPTAGCLAPGR